MAPKKINMGKIKIAVVTRQNLRREVFLMS